MTGYFYPALNNSGYRLQSGDGTNTFAPAEMLAPGSFSWADIYDTGIHAYPWSWDVPGDAFQDCDPRHRVVFTVNNTALGGETAGPLDIPPGIVSIAVQATFPTDLETPPDWVDAEVRGNGLIGRPVGVRAWLVSGRTYLALVSDFGTDTIADLVEAFRNPIEDSDSHVRLHFGWDGPPGGEVADHFGLAPFLDVGLWFYDEATEPDEITVAPPLRIYPRADALTGGAERIHPPVPSQQRGLRRGPGSYL